MPEGESCVNIPEVEECEQWLKMSGMVWENDTMDRYTFSLLGFLQPVVPFVVSYFIFSKIAQLDTEGFDVTLEHRPAQGAFRWVKDDPDYSFYKPKMRTLSLTIVEVSRGVTFFINLLLITSPF